MRRRSGAGRQTAARAPVRRPGAAASVPADGRLRVGGRAGSAGGVSAGAGSAGGASAGRARPAADGRATARRRGAGARARHGRGPVGVEHALAGDRAARPRPPGGRRAARRGRPGLGDVGPDPQARAQPPVAALGDGYARGDRQAGAGRVPRRSSAGSRGPRRPISAARTAASSTTATAASATPRIRTASTSTSCTRAATGACAMPGAPARSIACWPRISSTDSWPRGAVRVRRAAHAAARATQGRAGDPAPRRSPARADPPAGSGLLPARADGGLASDRPKRNGPHDGGPLQGRRDTAMWVQLCDRSLSEVRVGG